MDADDVQHIVLIAHLAEPSDLLLHGQSGEVILLRLVQLRDALARVVREWRLLKPFGPRLRLVRSGFSYDQPILSESLLVEQDRIAQSHDSRRVVASRVRTPVHLRIETDVVHQLQPFVRIGSGDVRRASPGEDLAPVDHVLVALRVPSEVVVVLQNQDPRLGHRLPEVVGRPETAQPATDHDQVVLFPGFLRLAPRLAVPHAMSHLERPRMAAPHSRACRRIVRLLARRLIDNRRCGRSQPAIAPLRPHIPRRKDRSRDRDARSAHEVATVDIPVHAQLTIALLHLMSPRASRYGQ